MNHIQIIHPLFITLITLSPNFEGDFFISSSESYKARIDSHIENVERYMGASQYSKACSEANMAATLIRKNLKSLKKIEPNYTWIEIKEVLININNKYC